MSSTARFGLPLLTAGQAQKELSHNEALTLIDALVQACAEAAGENEPPDDPSPGECWIVGAAPSGAWNGAAQRLAVWTGGGWRFVEPREGMAIHVRADALVATYLDGSWQLGMVAATEVTIAGHRVVGPRQPAVDEPSGGAVVDGEARTAIGAMLDALRTHGLIAG